MTDQDIAGYIDSTILKGEFSTLQDIPVIADALARLTQQQSDGADEPQSP